jgi:aerobic-type carbon monoxide dehydrogenase small subunit (CoxS/CutS family)
MAVMDSAHVTLVTVTVDGEPRTVMTDNRLSLPDLLPQRLGRTGTKDGCDHGQCGYRTPGPLCSAAGMLTGPGPSTVTADLAADPPLTPGEIRERMSGNLCRYGAYVNIVAARRGSRAVQRGTTGNEPA